jgi:ABC-2 type transport system ATP-binding protein
MRRTFDGEVTWDSERNRLLVPAPDGSSTMAAVVRVLDSAGVPAEDLSIHKPTLDDVFLSLTGSSASTDEEDEEMQP